MLSLSHFQNFISSQPKDFKLIINGTEYSFNIQSISAFSQEIQDFKRKNPSKNEYRLDIDVSPDTIESTISFLHGKQNLNFSNLLDTYYLSAHLNIPILKNRIESKVCTLVTSANYNKFYRRFAKFPEYLTPLLYFFSKNIPIFNEYFQMAEATNDCILQIFNFEPSLFETEDAKLLFLLHQFECKEHPCYQLLSNINFSKISPKMFKLLINNPNAQKFEKFVSFPIPNLSYFEFFNLISETEQVLEKLSNDIKDLEASYEIESQKVDEMNIILSQNNQNEELLIHKSLDYQKIIKTIIEKIPEIISHKEGLLANVQALSSILNLIKEIKQLSETMYENIVWFHNKLLGKLLYPESSPGCLKLTILWKNTMVELEKQVTNITPNANVFQEIFEIFASRLKTLETLSQSLAVL